MTKGAYRLMGLLCVAAISSPQVGWAMQDDDQASKPVTQQPAARSISGANLGPSADVETSNSSSRASLTYSFGDREFKAHNKDCTSDKTNKDCVSSKTLFKATLSAPLQSDNERTDFANQDGLANAFKGTFGLTRVVTYDNAFGTAEDACSEGSSDTLAILRTSRDILYADASLVEEVRNTIGENFEAYMSDNSCEAIVRLLEEAGDTTLRMRVPDAYRLLHKAKFLKSRQLSFYGVEVALGYEEFEFLNPDKFADMDAFQDSDLDATRSADRLPWSAAVHYGQVHRNGWIWKGGFRYERRYTAASAVTRCPVFEPGTTPVECLNGAPRQPEGEDAYIATFDVKKFLSLFDGKSQAVSFVSSYNFENDTVSFDLPVHLFADGDGRLTGGVRIGWRSDTDDPIFGIFVGTPLSLF